MKIKEMKIACDKCFKEQELDEDKSNENWRVYKNIEECECGGKFKLVIEGKEEG